MQDHVQSAVASLAGIIEQTELTGTALGNWRWQVRQKLVAVRDGLGTETAMITDGWLAARAGAVLRERNTLMARMMELGPEVLGSPDVEQVRDDLRRLVGEVNRHLQRLHDLAYDDVEMELGGSE